MYIHLIFITSILGFIRDYSKYKLFSFNKFIRTPLIILIFNVLLNILGYKESLLLSVIFETTKSGTYVPIARGVGGKMHFP